MTMDVQTDSTLSVILEHGIYGFSIHIWLGRNKNAEMGRNAMFGHCAGIHYQCHGVLVAQSLGFGT